MDVLNQFLGRVVTQVVNPIILLLAGSAFVVFVWGVFKFILHAGDEGERTKGREAMLWGLVGLVIIFGAYGIINLALSTFGISVPNQLHK
jgi:drug/metabolite transporter (DMT)-like permease